MQVWLEKVAKRLTEEFPHCPTTEDQVKQTVAIMEEELRSSPLVDVLRRFAKESSLGRLSAETWMDVGNVLDHFSEELGHDSIHHHR